MIQPLRASTIRYDIVVIQPLRASTIRYSRDTAITHHRENYGFSLNKIKVFQNLYLIEAMKTMLNVKTKSVLHFYVVPLVDWYQEEIV